MLISKTAEQLRPGDILSNNGATVTDVVLCTGGGYPDEICVGYTLEDGAMKFDYVAPSHPCYTWVPDVVH
jgi:hypothetical protein